MKLFPCKVKEPYSIVGYIAERVPLLDILRIVHPCQVQVLINRSTNSDLHFDIELRKRRETNV